MQNIIKANPCKTHQPINKHRFQTATGVMWPVTTLVIIMYSTDQVARITHVEESRSSTNYQSKIHMTLTFPFMTDYNHHLTQCLVRRLCQKSASAPWQSVRNNNGNHLTMKEINARFWRLLLNRRRKCLNIFLTWSSTVISVPKVLSVFHFSVKVKPYSDLLYLVSRLPATLLVSVLEEPDVLNSCKGQL